MDLNDRFASIGQIIKAKEAIAQIVIELEVVNNFIFEDIYFEQLLFDPVVNSDASEVDNLYIGSIEPANRIAR